jgi:multiple RNA-binding domain-containing protein 1
VIVPPAQTIAIVEFLEPTEARTAFKQLAYSRYKTSLLYLEKAPAGIFAVGYEESKQTPKPDTTESLPSETPIGSTLFVKNLNFSTTEDTLRQVFSPIGQLRNVIIRKKKDPKNPKQLLSMGFGFIEFVDSDAAKRALQSLQVRYVYIS